MGNDTEKPQVVGAMEVWDPGRALQDLKADQDKLGADMNETLYTEQLLRDASPMAAQTLIHLSQYSSNERIRLAAASNILDRTLGKAAQDGGFGGAGTQDPYQRLLAAAVIESKKKGTAIEVTSSHEDYVPLQEPPVNPNLMPGAADD